MFDDLDAYTGPAAGIATSMLWTATSLFFTAAGRRLGPTAVNTLRIGLAILLLGITHRLLQGAWLPDIVATRQVWLLAGSGIIGLAIGDQALFTAFVHIGPRISMLIMTTAPLFAAFFGWVALGETLGGFAWVGIVLVIGGVAWVVAERPRRPFDTGPSRRGVGILLAFVAAACQAAGLLLSKQGMGHGWLPREAHLAPQAATLMRMLFAGVGVVPIFTWYLYRQRGRITLLKRAAGSGSRRAGCLFAAGGAIAGPYLGVWMSLVATDQAPLGVAQTLCSLPPIFLLPFAATIHKEHISLRAILGAFVAVGGAGLLFFQAGQS
jgi:drug/metabolite transporter (DMT)-like permease